MGHSGGEMKRPWGWKIQSVLGGVLVSDELGVALSAGENC